MTAREHATPGLRVRNKSLKRRSRSETAALIALLAALGLGGVLPLTAIAAADGTPAAPTPPVPTPTPTPVPATPTPAPPAPTPTPTPTPAAPSNGGGLPIIPDDDGTPTPPDTTTPAATPTPAPTTTPATTPATTGTTGATPATGTTPTPTPTPTPSPNATAKATLSGKNLPGHANGNGSQQSSGEKLLGKFGKDLNISGGWSLRSTGDSVTGGSYASTSYGEQNTQTYDSRSLGPFQQSMDMTIQGKVFNAFTVNARLSNARYGNFYNQQFGFDYKSKGTQLDIGNINASLSGNQLVSLSRTMQGLMFSRDFGEGHVKMTGVASITKSVPKRGSITGNGTSGPYYLGGSNIIDGTEHMRLNGTDMVAGTDYKIDYVLGQVTFLGGRIINTTDTVEYSYESQNYNTAPGLLTGTRWDFSNGAGRNVGVTFIQQMSNVGGAGSGKIKDPFAVVSDLSYKYPLSAVIATNSTVVVRYLNVLLIENVDYSVNRDLGYILLLHAYPADTSLTGIDSLTVEYTAKTAAGVNGNRKVLGLDLAQPIGSMGNFSVQMGQSSGDSSQTGLGMTFSSTFHSQGKGHKNVWSITTGYRDIDSTFSNIDSVAAAFQQAEKGLTSNISFAPNDFVHLTTAFTNSQIATTSTTTSSTDATDTTSTTSWIANRNLNATVGLTFPNMPTLNLTHSQISQRSTSGSATSSMFSSDQLSVAWQKGIWGLTGALGRTSSVGQTVFGNYSSTVSTTTTTTTGTTSSNSDSSSTTSRLQLSLTPSAWLSLSGNIGLSKNHYGSTGSAASGSDATAQNTGLDINLMPRQNLTFTASFTDSTNGQSTSSYYTGTTTGTTTSASVTGQRTKATAFTVQYAPFDKLSLNANWNRSLSLIPGYDNSQSNTMDVGASYAIASKFQLAGQWSNQTVTYVGGEGNSNNQTYSMTGTAGPFGKMTFTSSLQRMNYGSAVYNSTSSSPSTGIITGTNTTSSAVLQQGLNTVFSLRGDYAIGGNRSLYLQWQNLDAAAPQSTYVNTTSNASSYAAQNYSRGMATVGLEIRLTQVMAFNLDANLINLKDHDDGRYSYNARTFNANLSARY